MALAAWGQSPRRARRASACVRTGKRLLPLLPGTDDFSFLNERSKELFWLEEHGAGPPRSPREKVFWFFFSKKNALFLTKYCFYYRFSGRTLRPP
jgi:hypothetical protein